MTSVDAEFSASTEVKRSHTFDLFLLAAMICVSRCTELELVCIRVKHDSASRLIIGREEVCNGAFFRGDLPTLLLKYG